MALTSGERAALWRKRQREDPEKHRLYREKERARNKKRKQAGQLKTIDQMNPREKRRTRHNWRKNQKNKRMNDAIILKHVEQQLSPPQSPDENFNREDHEAGTSKKKRGRPRSRKEHSKAYRELFQLRIELDKERRLKEKYKKQSYRMKKKSARNMSEIEREVDWRIKAEEIRKALTLHLIMVRNLKALYRNADTNLEKKRLRDIVWKNKMIKQLKLSKYAYNILGIKRVVQNKDHNPKRKERLPFLMKLIVTEYFERDDNSRILAGKKSTITRHGDKRQIRLLNDSIKNIHAKFLTENSSKMSYSLFCRLKPFWVIKPLEKHRETCLCKLHENIQYKINRLFQEKSIETNDLDAIIEKITCSSMNKECMYRECLECKDKEIKFKNADGRQVFWYAWKNIRTEKQVMNENGKLETKSQSKTVKEKEFGTLENLSTDVMNDLPRVCKHICNIRHQYSKIRQLKKSLDDSSVIIHIDFSENFNCKYVSEIQSTHFGASQRQISLHTGVLYLKDKTISFCTASDCLKHGPSAIWAHLSPVLIYVKSVADVNIVHFVSDGPTTQYRSKTNFFMLSKLLFHFGFEKGTWNFWEAGHGKGAPDGIGASIKRQADSLVHEQKRDIMTASDLIDGLKGLGTKIQLFEIMEKDIHEYEVLLQQTNIQPVQQTMKIHQVVVTEPCTISSRVLSCFCGWGCGCFCPWVTRFPCLQAEAITTGATDKEKKTSHKENSLCEVNVLRPVQVFDETLIEKYVVVTYDGLPFPGIILDVDEEEIEVKVMHRIGVNRYFWPLLEDRLWYKEDQIVTLLESAPEQVTKRHCQIDTQIWSLIEHSLNL